MVTFSSFKNVWVYKNYCVSLTQLGTVHILGPTKSATIYSKLKSMLTNGKFVKEATILKGEFGLLGQIGRVKNRG